MTWKSTSETLQHLSTGSGFHKKNVKTTVACKQDNQRQDTRNWITRIVIVHTVIQVWTRTESSLFLGHHLLKSSDNSEEEEAATFSRRLNFLAIIGRTSSTPTKLSKNGSNESSSLSFRSSNQLSIGIPFSNWNPNACKFKYNAPS